MFKLRVTIRNTRVLMMVASLSISGWVNAAEIQWIPKQDSAGFTVNIPSISIEGLVNDVVTVKSALRHDEKLLSNRVERGRISGKESLLSLLLPGGMIYAAYKKNEHANAVREHKLVSAQIKGITEDLAALTITTAPIVVAKR